MSSGEILKLKDDMGIVRNIPYSSLVDVKVMGLDLPSIGAFIYEYNLRGGTYPPSPESIKTIFANS